MQTPSKLPGSSEKLYEIPSCTICLQELVEDLSSLACGHIFHLGCISQHFQYRGTCPNCQKRASLKQVRTIHFAPVAKSNQAQIQINSVLSNIPPSEKNQMEALMNELKKVAEDGEKMKQKVASLESDVRSKDKTAAVLREEIYRHKDEGDRLIRENRKLNEAYKTAKAQLDQCVQSMEKLQKQNDKLRKQERQFEQMRRFKGLLQENSQEIVNYKQEMEIMCTPPQKMAKSFYEMLLMKNLEVLRAKSRIKELLDIENEKNGEISRQRSTIESLKRELKEQSEKRVIQQTKKEEVNVKQLGIADKTSKKGMKITDYMIDENSQSAANKNTLKTEQPMIQSTIRKPFFGIGSSTIGGFTNKKRDDKIKTTF